MTVRLRTWKWDRMPVYNGFTHEERVAGWQAMWWLIDTGQMTKPTICTISGKTDRIQMHSENYFDPMPIGIDPAIHMALHRRFRSPEPWRRIVETYAVTGDEWFAKLVLEPVDLATQLREHGVDLA